MLFTVLRKQVVEQMEAQVRLLLVALAVLPAV
jgi:hypothetical protein